MRFFSRAWTSWTCRVLCACSRAREKAGPAGCCSEALLTDVVVPATTAKMRELSLVLVLGCFSPLAEVKNKTAVLEECTLLKQHIYGM